MFGGSMVAVVTPMTADGEIDYQAWERLLRFHASEGTDALVVGGTTGESPTITTAELGELTRRALGILRGRMPVIAGAGTNSTARTVERARELSAMGVDALLVVTPYYNKPTQEGLYQHFRAVAAASSVPVIAYNVPSRTGVDLLPQTVTRLAQVPRITGLKEATGNIDRGRELVQGCPGGFDLLSGDDATAHELMAVGARGVISVTANVAPRLMHELCVAAAAGDKQKVSVLDGRLRELHRVLFVESSPIPTKWALSEMGLIGPGIRLPLTWLAPRYYAEVGAVLRKLGVLH
jgi:4-hydroxy-tetrahydrodipicolinate synthase